MSDSSVADPVDGPTDSRLLDADSRAAEGTRDSDDSSVTSSALRTEGTSDVAPSRCAGRWWRAVGLGLVVSMPTAWLLSYAATLPFFLGLFFFVLFGLMIGAVMHRAAAAGRPYGKASLVLGTTVVVIAGWAVSLAKESRDFPADMAAIAPNLTRDIGGRSVDEFRAAVVADVRRFLRESYPPGGAIGYARWVILSGELKKGQIAGVNRTLRRPQHGLWWAVRVVLSIGLLGFGVGSQTLQLTRRSDPAVRVMDEK